MRASYHRLIYSVRYPIQGERRPRLDRNEDIPGSGVNLIEMPSDSRSSLDLDPSLVCSFASKSRMQPTISRVSTAFQLEDTPQSTRETFKTIQTVDEPSNTDQGKRSLLSRVRTWHWKFEITLLLLSICSLATIVIILAMEDGTTLESWKFYFSLNTIISVLGTVSRSSLASAVGSCLAQEKWNWYRKRQDNLYMFDRIDGASRGSLGSFKLLFWMKF